MIMATQNAGWAGYQTFRSGQCAAIVYYSYRGLGPRNYNGVVARVGDTDDAAANVALGSANAKVTGMTNGRTQLAGTYCQS